MLSTLVPPRIRSLLFAAAATLVIAGCGEDDDHEHEPDIATMRLTIGGTTVNFTGGCTPSIGTVVIPAGGAAVTAQFLKADGSPETEVHEDEFRLEVTPAERFARQSAFAGTIAGGAAGSTQFTFALFHIEEGHEDYGPCNLTIQVQ